MSSTTLLTPSARAAKHAYAPAPSASKKRFVTMLSGSIRPDVDAIARRSVVARPVA
jgi:hypothetical protein